MATPTTNQGISIPDPTDADNVPYAISQAVGGIEPRLVMRFTTATARDAILTAPVAGMVAYLSTPKYLTVYDGSAWLVMGQSAWDPYTPTLTQVGTVTKNVSTGKYAQIGKTVHFQWDLAITGSGTTGNAMRLTLPVTAAAGTPIVGSFWYQDASPLTNYVGAVYLSTTTTCEGVLYNGTALGVNPNFAAASGDTYKGYITYEAA